MDYGNLAYLHRRDDASGRNDKRAGSVCSTCGWSSLFIASTSANLTTFPSLFCNPQTYIHGAFTGISTHAERQKTWANWLSHSHLRSSKAALCLLFQVFYCKQVSFSIFLVPRFSHFCAFCWCFFCLKCPWSIMLKGCLMLLSARRLSYALCKC